MSASLPSRRLRAVAVAVVCATVIAAACHRGGGTAAAVPADDFAALALRSVADRRLDESVELVMTAPIDGASIDGVVVVEGIAGRGVGTVATGELRVSSLPDGSFANSVLEFVPDLPTSSSPASLQPATAYRVTVAPPLRSVDGRELAQAVTFEFRTTDSLDPSTFFRAGAPGGPRPARAVARPLDGQLRLPIEGTAAAPLEVLVEFDQPVDPNASNVSALSTIEDRGPVWLEYDDLEYGASHTIECRRRVVRNLRDRGVVSLVPIGVLPNAASIRILVDNGLRDLAGEFLVLPRAPQTVGTVRTEDAYEVRAGALVESFDDDDLIDPGRSDVSVTFVGGAAVPPPSLPIDDPQPVGNFTTIAALTVLDTERQVLRYDDGSEREFVGGVFHVHHLIVRSGHELRGIGPNPLVIVVDGNARIDGAIRVDGGDAQPVAITEPDAPGIGVCGGGDGGAPRLADGTIEPEGGPGRGPGDVAAAGGAGGRFGCGVCPRGSGGGGGAFATAGDPGFPQTVSVGFPQRLGVGGAGCIGERGDPRRTLPGGAVGPTGFVDGDPGNDFFGRGFDPRRGVYFDGELSAPRGGSGGGAGGNYGIGDCRFPWAGAYGGGGGAGGGVIVLQVLGRITIGRDGAVSADGGHGMTGQLAKLDPRGEGGGGGGGSGGMVLLQSGERIVLEVNSAPFVFGGIDFPISADGGVCLPSALPGQPDPKYPPGFGTVTYADLYDARGRGGFGGMGVVQMSVPIGRGNQDGTNTVLDDNIDIVRAGRLLLGAEKRESLAWRGIADEDGVFVDDFGNPTGMGDGEGIIRPSPILLPTEYRSTATVRSRWVPLGAAVRRNVDEPDGWPRAVVAPGIAVGPDFEYPSSPDGWLQFVDRGGELWPEHPLLLPQAVAVLGNEPAAATGVTARRLLLPAGALDALVDRWRGYLCELRAADDAVLGYRRILASNADGIVVDAHEPLPAGVAGVQVAAGVLDVAEGPMPSYVALDGVRLPHASVRVGFAFHRNVLAARDVGTDPDRFPPIVGQFVYDLADPTTAAALRAFGVLAAQWEVTFAAPYRRDPSDDPGPPPTALDRTLRGIWLPFRY